MYSSIYSFWRRFFWQGGREIHRMLKELELSQWLSRDEIEEMQLKKIRKLLRHAYEYVPFYRQRYRKAGIHPEDIKDLKDFRSIPFLTREDVIQNRDLLISSQPMGKVFQDSTGGSTGQPMQFLMDKSTAWWSAAIETRYRGWYGVKLGDKRAWVWGALKDFPSWHWKDRLKAQINRYKYLNAHTMVRDRMKAFAEMLREWKPAMFRAYPSALFLFASYLKEEGITGITPKLIETSGEKLLSSQRKLFEEVFHAPVADHYSSWEIYDIAYQCPEGSRHVSEDRYLELVSEKGPVEAGMLGEVVITSLNQYAMPFIRYKNGDFAIYEKSNCSCGRGMPVLREIVGRAQDLITRPDGQLVYGGMFDYALHDMPEIEQFQVHQRTPTYIEVRLVCKTPVTRDWIKNIRLQIQSFFGEEMHISIRIVDRINLTPSGKLRTVVSELKPNIAGIEQTPFMPENYIEKLNNRSE